jgi:hypothetical protein
MKYGKLTLLYDTRLNPRNTVWVCRCDCGSRCLALASDLKSGKTQSCGCMDNKGITFNGKTLTIAEWAKETGIKPGTIRQRLKRGWSTERALTQRV